MPTYTSSGVASSVPARGGIETITVSRSYSVTSNLASSDVIQMVKIPKGATIIDLIASASASVGATASATVGDGGDVDRFITASQLGQGAAQLVAMNAPTGHGYTYTDDDTIDIRYSSIATAATGAVLRVTVVYTMQS